MATVKHLKKELQKLKNELLDELHIYEAFHPEANKKKLKEINATVEEEYQQLIKRIQHPENTTDSKAIRAHFNTIIQDIRVSFISLLDELEK